MKKSLPVSLRIRPDLMAEVRRLAVRLQRPKSYVLQGLIDEGLRQRRCPGIVFADGPIGRRAVIAGSGIDVWEVVRSYKAQTDDAEALTEAFPHLTRRQLEAAIHYYRCYPREIDERLVQEEEQARELLRRLPSVRTHRV